MSQGQRRFRRIQGVNFAGQIGLGEQLFNPSLGAPNNPLGTFPSGTTFDEFGLPDDFNLVPGQGPLIDLAAQRAGQFGSSDQGLARLDALAQQLSGDPSIQLDPALREEFFRNSIERPALQQLQRDILPSIAGRFLPRGQTGAFEAGASQAVTDVTSNLAGLRSGFLRDDERLRAHLAESALGRQAGAIPMSLQDELRQISVPAQIGGITRAIGGQQNQEQFLRALLGNPIFDPRIPLFGALSGNAGLLQQPGVLGGLSGLGSISQGGGGGFAGIFG